MDLLEYISHYKDAMLPMHMPGHKRNTSLAPYLEKLAANCDMTEIEGFDNLHDAHGILRDGMNRSAALWGSKRAFWLVNGSTCGILAAIWATVPKGGKVIVARNCHSSVYNGLLLRHAKPVYLMPDIDVQTGIFGALKPEDVCRALEQHPDTKLIILTSPTYEGVISDIESICTIAHAKGVPILIDEAHGAHLGFGFGFPKGAIQCGADIVIHSLHKTLPSLTQTAVLHLNSGRIEENAVEQALSIFETSSPSYLLMASISGCTTLLEERGNTLLRTWQENLLCFYGKMEGLHNLYFFDGLWMRDPSKIIICTNRTLLSGAELADLLRQKNHIEVEMASMQYVIAMTGMGDTAKSLDALADALLTIDAQAQPSRSRSVPMPMIPKRTMAPWETENCSHELVTLAQAVERVSAETIWAYPPGIPLVLPGEVIDLAVVELMHHYRVAGIQLKSSSGQMPETIRVLTD